MRTLVIAAFAFACLYLPGICDTANGRDRSRLVDGKVVRPDAPLQGSPIVEVKDLKTVRCTVLDTGAGCTVITGTLLSHCPSSNCDVTIEIELYLSRTGYLMQRGTAKTVLEKVQPEKQTPFIILAGPWVPEENQETWAKDGWRLGYEIRTRITPHAARPPDPK